MGDEPTIGPGIHSGDKIRPRRPTERTNAECVGHRFTGTREFIYRSDIRLGYRSPREHLRANVQAARPGSTPIAANSHERLFVVTTIKNRH